MSGVLFLRVSQWMPTDSLPILTTAGSGIGGVIAQTAEELAGGIGSLSGPHPDRIVGSFWPYAPPLFDYIRRAMPADAPLSLDNDAVYALTAYLLLLNGLVGEAVLVDADHLSRIQMPNREGFIRDQDRAAAR